MKKEIEHKAICNNCEYEWTAIIEDYGKYKNGDEVEIQCHNCNHCFMIILQFRTILINNR